MRKIRIVKFWGKLLESESYILKSVYQDLFKRTEKYPCVKYRRKKKCYFHCHFGFGEVWYCQNVTNKRLFLDIYIYDISQHIDQTT